MNNPRSKKIFLITSFVLLLTISYWRETGTITVNSIYYKEAYNYSNTKPPEFLLTMPYNQLKMLKYGIAIFFNALCPLLAFLVVHKTFLNKKLTQITVFIYAALFLLILLMALSGMVFKTDLFFHNIRFIDSIIVSPALVFFLVVTYWGFGKMNKV